MNRLRDEAGFTLTELLTAMALMIVILAATLAVLDSFVLTSKRNASANDMRESARLGVDTLAKELRNVAGLGQQAPPIERTQPFDLVFDMTNPDGPTGGTLRRVRYCLEQPSPTTGTLWKQIQPYNPTTAGAPPSLPATTSCPSPSFGSQATVVRGAVNGAVVREGANPPIFTYDNTDPAQLASIGIDLLVDGDIATAPTEMRLGTRVRLRNRNRRPVAAFTVSPQGSGHVLLNGEGSSDPEGDELQYSWYCNNCPNPQPGTGPVLDYTTTPGTHTFSLKVVDPGDLTNPSPNPSQTVVVT